MCPDSVWMVTALVAGRQLPQPSGAAGRLPPTETLLAAYRSDAARAFSSQGRRTLLGMAYGERSCRERSPRATAFEYFVFDLETIRQGFGRSPTPEAEC